MKLRPGNSKFKLSLEVTYIHFQKCLTYSNKKIWTTDPYLITLLLKLSSMTNKKGMKKFAKLPVISLEKFVWDFFYDLKVITLFEEGNFLDSYFLGVT